MSFSVRIASDLVSVEAGATVPLAIEIANRSDEQDRFEMEIEGLDPDWTAVPVPTFSVDPRDIQTEKIFFKPPRVSESLSGTFPFVVKVRSLISGEQRTAQGILEIKPYHHLTMELSPKKGVYSSVTKTNQFHATIMNLGNTEHTLQLFASDPEDALAYEFSNEQMSIGPGQTKTIVVSVKPTESRPFASSRLHGFTVTARSIETPSVVCSSQAQLEERPFLAPSYLILGLLFLLLFAVWYALIPKPPKIDSLSVSPPSPVVGQDLLIEWSSSSANSVRLTIGTDVIDGLRANGSYKYRVVAPATLVVTAQALRDKKESPIVSRSIIIGTLPPVPDPVIERFDITPRQAKLGDSLLIKYRLGESVSSATLEPANVSLEKTLEQIRITADIAGPVTYRIVALNAAGKTASKSVTVQVSEGSDASIVYFKVEPTRLPFQGGTVSVNWQTSKAARIVLKVGSEEFTLESDSGSREFVVGGNTEFSLIAYDVQGRTVSRKQRVEVESPPDLTPTTATTGGTIGPPGPGGLR